MARADESADEEAEVREHLEAVCEAELDDVAEEAPEDAVLVEAPDEE